jgi:predicted transcriptional regulator
MASILTIRVDDDMIDRLDAAAEELTKRLSGVAVDRSKAARAAIARGLECIEAEAKRPRR